MRGVAVLLVTIAAVAATDCPPNWPPEQLLPHEDCHKYYQCVWGKKVAMICPEDLYFNDATWQCDWQANVQCGDRNPPAECTTTTTPAPTTTPTPCNQTDPTTTTTPEPTTTPTTTPPTTPTTTPTTTTTTTPAPTTTPPPCSTDPVTPSTGTTPTTAITPPPDGFLSNGCPVNPHVHWLLPVPGCCNSFYYCVWGQLVQRSCPPTLHFNKRIQVCDWPWSAGCA